MGVRVRGSPTSRAFREVGLSRRGGGMPSILHVGVLLLAPAKHLLAQLPDSPGAPFADLGRAFPGADSNVLAGPSGAFAKIGGGMAGVQGNEIASGSGSAFAQALRPLACAFANVLTALADFFAGTGLLFLFRILLHE